jgi:predicted DNA-binding mobile mystery protein A
MTKPKSAELKWLRLRQLDERLDPWIQLAAYPRPGKGWVATVRQALGMGLTQLGRKVGMNPSAVLRLEERERSGNITLATLSRVAAAMDCRLVYAIVPNKSLQSVVERQIRKVADDRLARVGHTMDLEAQGVGEQETPRQQAALIHRIASEWPRHLWDDAVPNDGE